MASYVIEIIGEHGYADYVDERELDFDPRLNESGTSDLISDLLSQHRAKFHPVVGEKNYSDGWYRLCINISPPSEEDE